MSNEPTPEYIPDAGQKKGALHTPRTMSGVHQLFLLLHRYYTIFYRDRNAMMVFAQAPLLGVLLGFVFNLDATYLPMSFYFCMTITSIWIGGVSTVREIAREGSLVERDIRGWALDIFVYVFQKRFFSAVSLLYRRCLCRISFTSFQIAGF